MQEISIDPICSKNLKRVYAEWIKMYFSDNKQVIQVNAPQESTVYHKHQIEDDSDRRITHNTKSIVRKLRMLQRSFSLNCEVNWQNALYWLDVNNNNKVYLPAKILLIYIYYCFNYKYIYYFFIYIYYILTNKQNKVTEACVTITKKAILNMNLLLIINSLMKFS